MLTVVEDGATASQQLKKFASHVEESQGTSPKVTTEVAQSNNEAGPRGRTGRLDETSGTSASDVRQRKTTAKVQCNLKTMNEQQRAEEWETTLHGRD